MAAAFQEVGRTVHVLPVPNAEALRSFDGRGQRYYLVHVGPDDGEPEGSFSRAHYRIDGPEAVALAQRLRPRETVLVRCRAFGYKHHGVPEDANFLFDVRSLRNPYWEPDLRELTGLDALVRDYVFEDPRAQEFLENAIATVRSVIPIAYEDERFELVVAFGCTGGRHRSVAAAWKMAERLAEMENVDVALEAPGIEGAR